MLNRIKNLIGLSKNISASGVLYIEDGKVYTYHESQILQAISDITADKKTIELGLEKGIYKITLDSFSDFEKQYKSNYTDFHREGNTLIIKTDKPNIDYKEGWSPKDDIYLQKSKKFFKDIDKIITDDDNFISEIVWSEDDINTFTKEKPVRFYLNFDNDSLTFEHPPDSVESFLMISLLNSYVGKINKSSKSVKTRIFSTHDDSIYLFNMEVVNGKCVTQYYGLTLDSLSGEGVDSCQ